MKVFYCILLKQHFTLVLFCVFLINQVGLRILKNNNAGTGKWNVFWAGSKLQIASLLQAINRNNFTSALNLLLVKTKSLLFWSTVSIFNIAFPIKKQPQMGQGIVQNCITESASTASFPLCESYHHKPFASFLLPLLYLLSGGCHIRDCSQNSLHSSPIGAWRNLWQMLRHHAVFREQCINLINVFAALWPCQRFHSQLNGKIKIASYRNWSWCLI